MTKFNIFVTFEFDKVKDLKSSFYTQALFRLTPTPTGSSTYRSDGERDLTSEAVMCKIHTHT